MSAYIIYIHNVTPLTHLPSPHASINLSSRDLMSDEEEVNYREQLYFAISLKQPAKTGITLEVEPACTTLSQEDSPQCSWRIKAALDNTGKK